MDAMKYLLLFSLATNNLIYYGKGHFKLFTNCHVKKNNLYVNCMYTVKQTRNEKSENLLLIILIIHLRIHNINIHLAS